MRRILAILFIVLASTTVVSANYPDINTLALLHMNGTNGGTTFRDESTWILWNLTTGSPTTSTSQIKFGSASGSFSGSGISNANNGDLALANGKNWTFDCWVYPSSVTGYKAIAGDRLDDSAAAQWALITNGGDPIFQTSDGSTTASITASAGSLSVGSWQHIEIDKQADNLFTMYINGRANGTATSTVTVTTSRPFVSIGSLPAGETSVFIPFDGYVDEARFSNSTRHFAPFTPSTSEYTADAAPAAPIVSFTSNNTSGVSPLGVQFNDTSVLSPTGWNWSFTNVTPGNNTQVWWSTIRNASQTFGMGNYSIKLNVTNASGYNVSTVPYFINVSAPTSGTPITASFTQSVNPSSPGQSVNFNDTSTGTPVTWNWSLTGGAFSNSTRNASYTYSTVGTYTVYLNVTNATGFWSNTSQTHTVANTSAFTQQDIWMTPQYTLTLYVVDSTGISIPNAMFTDSATGISTNTTTGMFSLSYPFGAVAYVISASGYTSKAGSVFVDNDTSITVQLSKTTSTTPYAVTYPPKDTRFHLQTIWGQQISGATVTARTSQTTVGNYSYVASLYGYTLTNVPLDTLVLNGSTDTRGDITFAMMADTQYAMTYSAPGYTFPTGTTITPHDDNYVIYANQNGSVFVDNGTSPQASVRFTSQYTRYNQTAALLYINYTDSASITIGGVVTVSRMNTTYNSSSVTFATTSFSGSTNATPYVLYDGATTACPASSSAVLTLSGAKVSCWNQTLVNDQSYQVSAVGNTPSGQVNTQNAIWFRNIASPVAALSAEFALFAALGIMMFTAMMAGVTTAPAISLCVTFEGWVFWGMNCFNIIDYPLQNIPGTSAVVGVLTIMTFVTFIYLFVEYRRRGK